MILLKADLSGIDLTGLIGLIGLMPTVPPVSAAPFLMVSSVTGLSRTQDHLDLGFQNFRLRHFDDFVVDEYHPASLIRRR